MQAHRLHDYFEPDTFCRAVQDHLGDALVLRLRQTLGGRDIRIPRADSAVPDDHPLVQAVGRADAERLCGLCGGEQVYIPKIGNREDAYMDALNEGLRNVEIAQRLGVSERQVRRYFASHNVTNPNRLNNMRRDLCCRDAAGASAIAAE